MRRGCGFRGTEQRQQGEPATPNLPPVAPATQVAAARRLSGRWVWGVLAAIVVLASGSSALADPYDEKREIDRELAAVRATLEAATERARAAGVAYTEATLALPDAQQRLAEAKGVVAAARVTLNRARREAAAARRAYAFASERYQAAQEQVDRARERMGTFASAAYKGGGIVALQSVFSARSPSDLADRMAFLNEVAQQHREALENVIQARHRAKILQNRALLAKRETERNERAAQRALEAAEEAQKAAEAAATAVQELVAERERALAIAEAERDATLARYRELEKQSERIAAVIRGLANADRRAGKTSRPAAGRSFGQGFLMPTSGWKSSDFGNRWDPYYKVWQLHAGVDIAAPGGTPIRAVAAGRVIRAGWYGGYGNYTCIYHGLYRGQGLATCYGHQSRILVSKGQWVARGQVIGQVGTTGASTGNHLHFEVRLDGTPVNPLPWLPRCLC